MIDLTPFCGKDGHYTPSTPWFESGHIYATDGHVCVRVPAEAGLGNEAEDDKPKGLILGWPTGDETWLPWPPVIPIPGEEECPMCGGKRFVHGDQLCRHCEGGGWCSCRSCGDRHNCWHCDGTGKADTDCPTCRGRGKVETPYAYRQIGPVAIARKYDELIRALPNVQFVMPVSNEPWVRTRVSESKVTYSARAILFRFDGGEGLVMPADGAAEAPA